MDIRIMEYYLAVVREGNISAAAQALHVSQPGLSRQMRDLEEKIGAVRRSLQISSALEALESAADLARQQDLPEIRTYIDCAIGRLKE